MLSSFKPFLLLDCLVPPLLQYLGSTARDDYCIAVLSPNVWGTPPDSPVRYLNRGLAGCRLSSSEAALAYYYREANSNIRKKYPIKLPGGRIWGFFRKSVLYVCGKVLMCFTPNLLRKAGEILLLLLGRPRHLRCSGVQVRRAKNGSGLLEWRLPAAGEVLVLCFSF